MSDQASADGLSGFILTRQWRDRPLASTGGRLRGLQLSFWLTTPRGPRQVLFEQQSALCFLAAEDAPRARQVLERALGQSIVHPAVPPAWEIRPLALRDFNMGAVVGLYCREQRLLYRAREALTRQGLAPLEADIQPTDRFLMERFITGAVQIQAAAGDLAGQGPLRNPQLRPAQYSPAFRVLSLDIETSLDGESLYSIGAVMGDSDGRVRQRRVMMIGAGTAPAAQPWLDFYDDEHQLLQAFLDWLRDIDPDILIGWNVINFDLRCLQRKADALGMVFALGRDGAPPEWRQSRDDPDYHTLVVPGRLVLDGIDTLRAATYSFESFSLEYVSRQMLQRGKLSDSVDHRGEQITEQFLHDKPALAAYNLEDCQLVWDIFQHARLFDFAVERAQLTGLAMDRVGGSVAAFDHRYLPRLHRRGYVAPMLPRNPRGVGSPGGYVMNSEPGFYEHVLVLDFKSLYPSIIRTFRIDPLARVVGAEQEREQTGKPRAELQDQRETAAVECRTLVPGFNGAVFSKGDALLPDLIGELWQARDRAKHEGNSPLSQAIKILMNSFYGVLGTPGCRFFDYRLPSSITLRGHQVLTRTRQLIEERGHRVIYGDTDSVFVHLSDAKALQATDIAARGRELAAWLNRWWADCLRRDYDLDSYLEIEFETHYTRFLMPTIRGTETGSKKRYAGLVERPGAAPELVFKGLEAVRSDWTPLAREFQRELYRRIFLGLDYEVYIHQTLAAIRAGECDTRLLLRKRIRRPLAEYTRNLPPQVQAARKADAWRLQQGQPARYVRGGWITYALTVNGPEPLERLCSSLDYDLLIERQIAPIVDAILRFLGTSFANIADRQLGLFGSSGPAQTVVEPPSET